MGAMRHLAVALCLTSGCAWIFQSKPEDTYAPNTQPQCSDSSGWAVVDGVFAVLNAGAVIAVASDDTVSDDTKTGYVLGGVAEMLLHLASAGSGVSWASKCREAKAEWARAAGGGSDEGRRQTGVTQEWCVEGKCFSELAACRAHAGMTGASEGCSTKTTPIFGPPDKPSTATVVTLPPVVFAPRGFYCSASPSNAAAGFCVRDKAECARTRDLSIAALPDLGECALTERAWCVSDLCFPAREACDARRARTGIADDCKERE